MPFCMCKSGLRGRMADIILRKQESPIAAEPVSSRRRLPNQESFLSKSYRRFSQDTSAKSTADRDFHKGVYGKTACAGTDFCEKEE